MILHHGVNGFGRGLTNVVNPAVVSLKTQADFWIGGGHERFAQLGRQHHVITVAIHRKELTVDFDFNAMTDVLIMLAAVGAISEKSDRD